MARAKKFNYDSDDFYDEIYALSMQGLTDAEIANALEDKFGEKLSSDTFGKMKNGNYTGWSEKDNKRRSERICRVLAHGRMKVNSIVRGMYLKAALGGKKLKNISQTKRHLRLSDGTMTNDEEVQTTESEIELPPNIQALSTWLYHHDPEWRKVERKQDDDEIPKVTVHGIGIDEWIKSRVE